MFGICDIRGSLYMFITLVLSQYITTSSVISSFIPFNICLIHTMFEQLIVVATYSTSTIDCEIKIFFLLVHETNLLPRKKLLQFYSFYNLSFHPNQHLCKLLAQTCHSSCTIIHSLMYISDILVSFLQPSCDFPYY